MTTSTETAAPTVGTTAVRIAMRVAAALTVTLAVAASIAVSAGATTLERGFGVEKPGNDALQMDRNHWSHNASSTGVSDYLDYDKADWVHVSIGWCQLQNSAGDWNMGKINSIVGYVQDAVNENKNAVVTLVPKAPAFTRYVFLRRDKDGNPWSGTGCGTPQNSPTYPTGDWAPDFTTTQAANTSMWNYLLTTKILHDCLARTGYTNPGPSGGSCPDTGTSLTPNVMVQFGAEQNNENSWQNGVCGSDTPYDGDNWHSTPDDSCGSTRSACQSNSPPSNCQGPGTIRKIDAEFNFDFMNFVGKQAQDQGWFQTIMGAPWFHKQNDVPDWGGSIVAGAPYLDQELKSVSNDCPANSNTLCGWTEVGGYHFTELSMQFGTCRDDPDTSVDESVWNQWRGCPGSVGDHLDSARQVMSDNGVSKPIAFTGLFVPQVWTNDTGPQAEKYAGIYNGVRTNGYCDAADPRPVTLIIFARLVDSNPADTQENQFPDIGFMNPTGFEVGGTYDRDPIWPYAGKESYTDFNTIPMGCS